MSSAPPIMAPRGAPLLELRAIRKAFAGVLALDGVGLAVAAGEVHGLIGQNGAGKSTLMAVAAGALAADEGTVLIGGHEASGNPQRARELGLAMVRQEPALMPDLTVAENLYLGVLARWRPPLGQLGIWAERCLHESGAGDAIHPAMRVEGLSAKQRFMTEIAKALAGTPRVLVLDEPTEHLASADIDPLFDRIRALAAAGTAVVYISHRIREVQRIADRITVLRDGLAQGPYAADALSEAEIVRLIVGNSLEREFPPKLAAGAAGAPVLEVQGLSGRGFRDVELRLGHGEILGLAGILDNGQSAFVRALAGLRGSRGSVRIGGRALTIQGVHSAARAGIRYLPGDRHRDGLFADLGVRENYSLRSLSLDTRAGLLWLGREVRRATAAVARYGVKTPGLETPVGLLSGGNQQKLMLAGVLDSEPTLLLVEEPSNGVDVGTRVQIYARLREAAARGIPVVVVSSDAMELAGLCDRVAIFSRGRVVQTLGGDEVAEDRITEAIASATNPRDVDAPPRPARRRRADSDHASLAGLALAVLLLGAYANVVNEFYLTSLSLSELMVMSATLALVAYGQQAVMLIGGIDLSVGPLLGLVQVVASFYLLPEASAGTQMTGWLLILATCLAVGCVNWLLIGPLQLQPMIATLITYMAVQAVALMLRPAPTGLFDTDLTDALELRLGPLPVTLIAAIALALLFDGALRRSRLGIGWRGFGSHAEAARVAGVPIAGIRLAACLGCSMLTGLAAISLLGQVGIGDARAGLGYTLTSIAAVVIGGASLTGGRGSFVGALLGAVFIAQINAVTAFLQLDGAWQQYLLGGMIIAAVGLYGRARRVASAP